MALDIAGAAPTSPNTIVARVGSAFTLPTKITIAHWFYDESGGEVPLQPTFWAFTRTSTAYYFKGWMDGWNFAKTYRINWDGDSSGGFNTGWNPGTNKWYGVVVTLDTSTGTLERVSYIDATEGGMPLNNISLTGQTTGGFQTYSDNFYAGRFSSTGTGILNGGMGPYQLWNVALTDAEAKTALLSPGTVYSGNLIAHYTFEAVSGTDASGNSETVTVDNATLWSGTAGPWSYSSATLRRRPALLTTRRERKATVSRIVTRTWAGPPTTFVPPAGGGGDFFRTRYY